MFARAADRDDTRELVRRLEDEPPNSDLSAKLSKSLQHHIAGRLAGSNSTAAILIFRRLNLQADWLKVLVLAARMDASLGKRGTPAARRLP